MRHVTTIASHMPVSVIITVIVAMSHVVGMAVRVLMVHWDKDSTEEYGCE